MKFFLMVLVLFLVLFNQTFFAALTKDLSSLSSVRLSNEEINDLFNSNSWDFKEIISEVETFKVLNESSEDMMNFAYEVLLRRDFIITSYLSKYEENSQNLGKIKRFLEIRFNMWVVQFRLLPLLKECDINLFYNQEKNRFEKI